MKKENKKIEIKIFWQKEDKEQLTRLINCYGVAAIILQLRDYCAEKKIEYMQKNITDKDWYEYEKLSQCLSKKHAYLEEKLNDIFKVD